MAPGAPSVLRGLIGPRVAPPSRRRCVSTRICSLKGLRIGQNIRGRGGGQGTLSAAPAGASKRWTEPEIEKAVEATVSECSVGIYARAPRPNHGCTKQLEVLVDLKDRAVPVVTRKLLRSVDEKARGPAKLQQSTLVRMLGMIRTPASTLALISVLEYPGVQQDGLSVARSVHNQLLLRSGNHLEFTGQTEEELRQLAAAWRRWWNEQAPAQPQQIAADPKKAVS